MTTKSDPWNISPEAIAAQERQMVADLGTAYDLSSAIKNRNTNRYAYPTLPNFNQELQIDRARAQSDAMNRIRQQAAYRKSLAEATELAAAQGKTGTGNSNALGSFLQGAGALAPWLFGQNGVNDIMRDGVLGWTKDAFGNWTKTPTKVPTPATGYTVSPDGTFTGPNQPTPIDPNYVGDLPLNTDIVGSFDNLDGTFIGPNQPTPIDPNYFGDLPLDTDILGDLFGNISGWL